MGVGKSLRIAGLLVAFALVVSACGTSTSDDVPDTTDAPVNPSTDTTVVDLQGPAYRKTIPIVLYLGLCQLRSEGPEDA